MRSFCGELIDQMPTPTKPKIVVFSGGTGGNAIVPAIQAISHNVTYILPISDNGGSTSEILRVLGGIGVGDLRSRLIHLIPHAPESSERHAIKTLLSHRLDVTSSTARLGWLDIVEGSSALWRNITNEKNQAIRSFLRVFNSEIIKRARPTNSFNFSTGSIGNFFLTGMRLFFGSIETAIFMFASITGIDPATQVLPIINTSHMTPIAARLSDGTVIAGQNAISHPSSTTIDKTVDEDALPGQVSLSTGISYDKNSEDLSSPIEEVYYINPYGQRTTPTANPRVVEAIKDADAVIFAPGSLYTSLVPLLVLPPVAAALRGLNKPKVMLLNRCNDRETPNYTAQDYVTALESAAAGEGGNVVSHLVYLPSSPFINVTIPTIKVGSYDEKLEYLLRPLITSNATRRSTITR